MRLWDRQSLPQNEDGHTYCLFRAKASERNPRGQDDPMVGFKSPPGPCTLSSKNKHFGMYEQAHLVSALVKSVCPTQMGFIFVADVVPLLNYRCKARLPQPVGHLPAPGTSAVSFRLIVNEPNSPNRVCWPR